MRISHWTRSVSENLLIGPVQQTHIKFIRALTKGVF